MESWPSFSSWAPREVRRSPTADYLDETPVFQALERHEKEPEYWFDYGRRDDTRQDMIWHNVAFEYGVTERFMVDGRLRLAEPEGGETSFESGRFEVRKRFGGKGTGRSTSPSRERSTSRGTTRGSRSTVWSRG